MTGSNRRYVLNARVPFGIKRPKSNNRLQARDHKPFKIEKYTVLLNCAEIT